MPFASPSTSTCLLVGYCVPATASLHATSSLPWTPNTSVLGKVEAGMEVLRFMENPTSLIHMFPANTHPTYTRSPT